MTTKHWLSDIGCDGHECPNVIKPTGDGETEAVYQMPMGWMQVHIWRGDAMEILDFCGLGHLQAWIENEKRQK